MLIGLWVLPRTWTLLREAGQVLMQGVPQGHEDDEVRQALCCPPGVVGVHDLHVWALGSKQPVLTAHVVVDDASDATALRAGSRTDAGRAIRHRAHDAAGRVESESDHGGREMHA